MTAWAAASTPSGPQNKKVPLTARPASSLVVDSEKTLLHGESTAGGHVTSGSDLLENVSRICSIIWEARDEHRKEEGSSLEGERMAVDRMREVIMLGERVVAAAAAAGVKGDNPGIYLEADGDSKVMREVLEAGRMFCEGLGDDEGAGKLEGMGAVLGS